MLTKGLYNVNTQKGTALPILLIALVLIGVILGFIYLKKDTKPAPTPTQQIQEDSLKTYTDQILGFEFKYAKELKAQDDSEEKFNERGNGDFRKNFKGYIGYEPGEFLGAVVVLDPSESFDKNPFTVWVFDNQNDLSIDKWYENFWYYPFVWGDFTSNGKIKFAPKDEATISGQMAKSGNIDYQPGKPKFVYISKDGRMYLFRIIGEEGDKILSSFSYSR